MKSILPFGPTWRFRSLNCNSIYHAQSRPRKIALPHVLTG
jgi:hypothetical protein